MILGNWIVNHKVKPSLNKNLCCGFYFLRFHTMALDEPAGLPLDDAGTRRKDQVIDR
jgi:hypothetical protein